MCIRNDFFGAGSKEFQKTIIERLYKTFSMGNTASSSFKYIGANVESRKNGAAVNQLHFAATLSKVPVSVKWLMNKTAVLSEHERAEYRHLVGQINWIAANTRTDIAFDACELSSLCNWATVNELLRLNKLIDRVQADCSGLIFPQLAVLTFVSHLCSPHHSH